MIRQTKRGNDASDDEPPRAKEPRSAAAMSRETRVQQKSNTAEDQSSSSSALDTRGIVLQNVQDALQNVQDALQHVQDAPRNVQDDLQNAQDTLQNIRVALHNVVDTPQIVQKAPENVSHNEKVIALIRENDPRVCRIIDIFPVTRLGTDTSHADLPDIRTHACLNVINNFAYVIGGLVDDAPTKSVIYLNLESNRKNGTWYDASAMKTARSHHACAVLNGKIYATGGRTNEKSTLGGICNTSEMYDPGTDKWTIIEHKMVNYRCQHSIVAFKGELFVFGGLGNKCESGLEMSIEDVEKFSPVKQQWKKLNKELTTGRINGAAVCFRNNIWLLGGRATKENETGKTCLEFNGEIPTTEKIPDFKRSQGEVSAVVYNDAVYVSGKPAGKPSSTIHHFFEEDWRSLSIPIYKKKGGIIYSNCLAAYELNNSRVTSTSSGN